MSVGPFTLSGRPPHSAPSLALALYSCAGGFGDTFGFLVSGSFTGHVTGNLVLLTISLVQRRWSTALRPLVTALLFLASTEVGLRVSAALPGKSRLFLPLAQIPLILLLRLFVNHSAPCYDILLLVAFSISLGLQNGVVTSESGKAVHSTYLSGAATTALQALDQIARSNADVRHSGLLVSAVIIFFFIGGAALAALVHGSLPSLGPVLFCVLLAAASLCSRCVVAETLAA